MEDINKGARPDFAPYWHMEVLGFKVTDPTAVDPDAPARMLYVNKPFQIVLTLRIDGYLDNLAGLDWATDFYADSLGVDVVGERRWHPAHAALPKIGDHVYEVVCNVPAGLPAQGLYEFGAVTRLPSKGFNAYVEGYHVEIAEFA